MYKAAVLTVSDRCSRGERADASGPVVKGLVVSLPAEVVRLDIVPDETAAVQKKLIDYADQLDLDLVVTTGGTGCGPRDITPEATRAVIDREVPGISELMRADGARMTRRAALSRGVCGLRGRTLILNLPGSPAGARQSLSSVMDILGHALEMAAGNDHN